MLVEVAPFETLCPAGYRSSGYRDDERGFRTEAGLTHVFQLVDPHPPVAWPLSGDVGVTDYALALAELSAEALTRSQLAVALMSAALTDAGYSVSHKEKTTDDTTATVIPSVIETSSVDSW